MIALLLTLIVAPAPPADTTTRAVPVALTVDDRHHQVDVIVGPFFVPAGMPMRDMDMMNMAQQESLVARFEWPADRRFHAVELAVLDAHGDPLPRRLLHHTYMINFDRRMLAYPLVERTFSFGEETPDLEVPATIGLQML